MEIHLTASQCHLTYQYVTHTQLTSQPIVLKVKKG